MNLLDGLEKMARTGIRASAIIIRDNRILLIHRRKEGREYWVFPGGGIEEGETGEETVLREVKEETGLIGENPKLAFVDFNVNAEHPFYFVAVKEEGVKLGGPEAERNSKNDWYQPEWVELRVIKGLNLLPESAKEKTLRLIKGASFNSSDQIDWEKVKEDFEKEMLDKLKELPGHREVSEELKGLRDIISHKLPETASRLLFRKLIRLVLSKKKIDVRKIMKVYLEPEIEKEKQKLTQHKTEFERLKREVKKWVEENLSEEKLQKMWKAHKTWLPRRYTIYKKQPTFQKIAADTLARFYLIRYKARRCSRSTYIFKGHKVTVIWIETNSIGRFRPITQVYGICFDNRGEILICRESPRDKWQLPGGKPESGESIKETLKREFFEEVNVKIKNIKVLGVQKVEFPNNPNKAEGETFYQLRCVCELEDLLPPSPDPATGKIWERRFVPTDQISQYIRWGEIGEAMFQKAVGIWKVKDI